MYHVKVKLNTSAHDTTYCFTSYELANAFREKVSLNNGENVYISDIIEVKLDLDFNKIIKELRSSAGCA